MTLKRLVWLVPLGALAAFIAWRSLRATPVVVSAAVRGPAIEAVYATGTVEADPRVVVKSRVSGIVAELLVKEGDRVKAGQLLARLDNKSLRFDLERVRADVRASAARSADRSPQMAGLRASRDSIQSDVELAKSELARAEGLVEKGAMARDELDRRRERFTKLKAEWAAADARVASLDIDLRAERERVGAAQGSLAAQNADTEVRAPMDGAVIRRRIELGEAVVVNQALFTVGNTDHLIVEVKIDEADVGRARVGQEVLVDLYAFASVAVTGQLAELLPDADRDTKTFLGKVELTKPPAGLRSGMSAEVNIVTQRHDGVVVVAAGAVAAGGSEVMVLDGNRVRARKVQVGLRDPRRAEIVSGIKEGEQVVLVGPRGLGDGDRVSATVGEAPLAERKPSQNTMTVK